jgi:hypothetical protein
MESHPAPNLKQGKFSAVSGTGRYGVLLSMNVMADGIWALVTGGERAHVGGVVLSVPRKSFAGAGISCDTWIVPVPGHRDTDLAAPLAEELCRRTGCTVSMSAGIHIENATKEEILILKENAARAFASVLEQILEAPGGN